MCGIAGFYAPRDFKHLSAHLNRATHMLARRGPDDGGTYTDSLHGVGLGHRRLSIIDLTNAGHQPMLSADEQYAIVYNGELYNFLEIRRELEGVGYGFRSATDTEVILNAYRHWGSDCLGRLTGMFAFAIWDRKKKSIILARDRIGIKPLFYYFNLQTLIFASELKALLGFQFVEKEIDPDALPLYLHYQYIPAPRTIFRNIFKLEPGSFVLFDAKNLMAERYWSVPGCGCVESDSLTSEEQWLDRLDDVLTQAVSDHLVSDVPLGALLSGGIDSSLVVALMQKTSPGSVRTFSIGFDDQNYNEAPWAGKIAAHLGTDHTELYVEPTQALHVIPQLADIYDEPFADASAIPTYLVSKLTRSNVTVALSGDGGDEQFAGYVRYWMTRSMADWLRRLPLGIRVPLGKTLGLLPVQWVEQCYLPWRDYLPQRFRVANFKDKWQKLIRQVGQERLTELYRTTICLWGAQEIADLIGQRLPKSRYETVFQAGSGCPVLSRLMYVDQHTYLPDCMLTKVDRASMAVSLEVRVPLLDHRVVEFTSRLPEGLKYRNGAGKYLLKKVLARYVPRELFERPKMGFGIPLDQWLRGELKELMLDYLSPERLKREGRFNADRVTRTINAHLNGSCSHHHRLWALLMWQMWYERWME